MSYHDDTLLTCSQDLHADNIVFAFPGLAELSVQVWMRHLEDPDLIAVIPRRFEDQSESLPKYLVEAADITSVVESVISKHGTEDIYAVVIDFGSGEIQINSFWRTEKTNLVHHFTASRASDPITEPRIPPCICAPEILIRTLYLREGFYRPEWRFQGDIWSLGCSVSLCCVSTNVTRSILDRSTK